MRGRGSEGGIYTCPKYNIRVYERDDEDTSIVILGVYI